MRQKSEILQIDIFALSVDSGGFFVNIDHYDKGKILSSVNILEEETHIDFLKEFSIDPENVEESAWDRVRSLPTKEESDGYIDDEEKTKVNLSRLLLSQTFRQETLSRWGDIHKRMVVRRPQ